MFPSVITRFFGFIKNNFVKLLLILASYEALVVGAEYLFKNVVKMNTSFILRTVTFLVILSFISVTVNMFLGREIKFKRIIPGIKLICYSLVLVIAAFVLSVHIDLLIALLASIFFDQPLQNIMKALVSNFLISSVILCVMFAVFGFIEKPSIDNPILSGFSIFKNNKIFMILLCTSIAVLTAFVPALLSFSYLSFALFMCGTIFVMALYFVLKPEEIIVIEKNADEAQKESEKVKTNPRMSI